MAGYRKFIPRKKVPIADAPRRDDQSASEPPAPTPSEPKPELSRTVRVEPLSPALAAIEMWLAGLAGLDPLEPPCRGFRGDNWRYLHREAIRFVESPLARIAAEFGWSAVQLFGVHHVIGATRIDYCGALIVNAHGHRVTQATASLLRFESGLAAYRKDMDAALIVPVWDFKNPAQARQSECKDQT